MTKFWRGSLICGFFAALLPLASDVYAQLADTLQQARALPSRLQSCELHYTSTASGETKKTVTVDGNKFLIKLGGQRDLTLGFDGSKFWEKHGIERSAATGFSMTRRPVQGEMHPLIMPYIWFWSDSNTGQWSDLHSSQKWDEALARMTYRESQTVRGHDCEVYEVEHPQAKTVYTVALAKDLGGYPIQVRQSRLTVDVLEVKRHESGATVGVELALTTLINKSKHLQKVDLQSLKINQPVNWAAFRLDRSQIDFVKDTDTGLVERTGAEGDAGLPLKERYETALRDCALNGYGLMVVVCKDEPNAVKFVGENFLDGQASEDIAAYIQVVIKLAERGLSEADSAFFKQQGWTLPSAKHVLAYATDANGKELGRLELAVDAANSTSVAASFVKQWTPPLVDAEAKWRDAFAEAQRSNRRVWACVGSRYCAPCFRLSRWLGENSKTLEKDYVVLKFNGRETSLEPVEQRITRGKQQGVPFFAILDADENTIIDSEGPSGNVGYPGGIVGEQHLRKMLSETKKKLSGSEIDRLVKSLKD